MNKSLLMLLGGAIVISTFAIENNPGHAADFTSIPNTATAATSPAKSIRVKTDITGIRTIQLDEDGLQALGIRIANGNIYQALPNGGYVCYSKTGTTFPDLSKENKRKGVTHIRPVLVTDDTGTWRSYKCQELSKSDLQIENKVCVDEVAVAQQLPGLVPILVRSGQEYTVKDKIMGNWRPDVIFWYEHSDLLLQVLQPEW
jgi:hypothetical protein